MSPTSFTPDQAAQKFCPLVGGNCKVGDCHFWLWDRAGSSHVINWPPDLDKPVLSQYDNSILGFASDEDAKRHLKSKASAALSAMVGRKLLGGKVHSASLAKDGFQKINVVVISEETGDCCMRRMGGA